MSRAAFLFVPAILSAALFCGSRDYYQSIEISRVRVIAAPRGDSLAVYMEIRNFATVPDEIIAVRTKLAATFELRRATPRNLTRGSVRVKRLIIPAGGLIRLGPKTDFILLGKPRRAPRPGEVIKLVIVLKNAGRKMVPARVEAPSPE